MRQLGAARRLPAAAPDVRRRARVPPRLAAACAARDDRRAGADRRPRARALRRAAGDRGAGEHARRRRHRARAHGGGARAPTARSTARVNGDDFPWVMCWYPTPALAQDAGMTLPAFEDFLYGSVLLDWEAEHARLSRYAALFDAADEVRIVGDGTDLRLSLAGRRIEVDAGHRQHARRRVLRLPGRGLGRGHDRVHRVPAAAGAAASCAASGCASPRGRVVDASADARGGVPARDARHRRGRAPHRRARASAATPASRATWATCTSTRRSTARCTSRSASASPTWAGRTSRRSTGTRQGPAPRRADRARRPGRPGERHAGSSERRPGRSGRLRRCPRRRFG